MRVKGNPECTLCPLHVEAQSVCLMGHGAVPAKVMIIGEAPGYREDEINKPFAGKSGTLLDEWLELVGVKREDVYITNSVRCRPPDNRTPKRAEIKACSTYMAKEIRLVKPTHILMLGSTACQALWDPKAKITKMRGNIQERDGVTYMATFHPAYILRNPDMYDLVANDFKRFFGNVKGEVESIDDFSYTLVHTASRLGYLLEELDKAHTITFDLETNGLWPWKENALVNLIQFDLLPQKSTFALPLSHYQSPFKPLHTQKVIMAKIDEIIRNKFIVGHNGKFDTSWVKQIYGHAWDLGFDTMLADHLLDENRRHGLKDLAARFFGAPEYDLAVGKGGTAPLKILAEYGAKDVYYTRKLYLHHRAQLENDPMLERLFYNLVMPISNMYRDVEAVGVYVDRSKLGETKEYLENQKAEAQTRIDAYVPGLNVNSPKQVAHALFEILELEPLDTTPTGNASTSESVLLRLSAEHELPKLILKAREATKFLGTFVNSWMEKLDPTSRMHPSFKIHGTVTGRPSCVEPNLQQVPRDKRIRSIITAPPGWTLLETDLSQAELRIAAIESRDPTLLSIYRAKGDVHSTTAEQVSGMSADTVSPDVWKDARKKAKAVNFGFLYGMGWRKFIDYARDNYDTVVSEQEAQTFRDKFFETYSGLLPWHNRQVRKARKQGYVRTRLGRKRNLPDIYADGKGYRAQAERQAINSPVQGFAAEWTLMAALEISQTFSHDNVRLVGTVHDAILMEVRDEFLDQAAPVITRIMKEPYLLNVFDIELPIEMEAEISLGSWGSGIDWVNEQSLID